MSHQAVMQPALESRDPESPAVAFERVLNTEEAAILLQIHPKTLQKMAREGTVPAFRIGDLWRFRASALDEWLRSGYAQSTTRAVNTKGGIPVFTRTRYQYGSLETKERKKGNEVWEFRYYETDGRGERQRRAIMVGSLEEYPTESAARKSPAVQAILLRLNAEQPAAAAGAAEFGAVIARYEKEEMPERYSTRSAYKSYIKNHILPRWADTPMSAVRPMAVEDWLKGLDLAPKTKSHVRSLMHTIFQCAERWELTAKNPIKLVRVKGGTKRQKTPRVLTPEEFELLLPLIREPFRTMVLVAGCLGLRVSEIVALRWGDFDFPGLTLLVNRSIVHGRIGEVKTEYSRDSVPLDPALVEALMQHTKRSISTPEGWLFANPVTRKPYHQEEIQKRYIRKAGWQPRSAPISVGIRSGTATGPGWTKPGRLSPSKRS